MAGLVHLRACRTLPSRSDRPERVSHSIEVTIGAGKPDDAATADAGQQRVNLDPKCALNRWPPATSSTAVSAHRLPPSRSRVSASNPCAARFMSPLWPLAHIHRGHFMMCRHAAKSLIAVAVGARPCPGLRVRSGPSRSSRCDRPSARALSAPSRPATPARGSRSRRP
jgi:hypothetical protein